MNFPAFGEPVYSSPSSLFGGAILRLIQTIALTIFIGARAMAEPAFVFVHGAWVGEWYWDPIVSSLRAEGYEAYAVTLSGHGKDAANFGPDISVTDHVGDIVSLVRGKGLSEIILVAHSYGGKPAAGAWDQLRSEVRALVFIEAVAPYNPGPTVIPAPKNALANLMIQRPEIADTGLIPVAGNVQEKYSKQPLSPQSIKTVYGELKLANGPLPPTPAVYVLGAQSTARVFQEYAARTKDLRGWRVISLNAGHDVVFDAPHQLLDVLRAEVQKF